MKTLFLFTFMCAISICWNSTNAQDFLKTYNDPASPNSSVSFECITEQTDSSGNFFIGGHIGDTIALFKMNTSGTVLATYKIKPSPANTKLDAIMLVFDAATNSQKIVVLGNKQTSGGNEGFMFRFDKTNPAVDWFRQTASSSAIAYWDMADKAGSYYIVSGERRTDGSAVILKVVKATGIPSVNLNYKVAGLEDPEGIQLAGSTLYATGRYALPGGTPLGDGFRSCFTRINTATNPFTHLSTKYYIAPKYPTATARMYSTDILVRGNTAVMVGNGDDNNTADPFKNLNITKVNATTGVPLWSKKYDNPNTASDGILTEIRFDNTNNYIVMGFAVNATGALNKAKLWRVNQANGNLLWNRQYNLYRRTANNGATYGYGFAIAGNYIYAVGQNSTSGITKGVLLKVNSADGNVSSNNGAGCFDSLTIAKSDYNFYDTIPVSILTATISSPNSAKQISNLKIKDSLQCGKSCNCSLNVNYDGYQTAGTASCGDTIKATCNHNLYMTPILQCTDGSSQLISFTITDASNNTPSWAANYTGSGPLSIPQGVSGIYTLTYTWGGSDGTICGSCKIFINVQCCDTCTLSTKFSVVPGPRPRALNCADTVSMVCNSNYLFTPTLSCTNGSSTSITNVTIKDQQQNTPSWAAAFIAAMGSGTLNIPAGVSGYYTLTYTWGIGNTICGTCSYTLNIKCCTLAVNAGQDQITCCPSAGTPLNALITGANSFYTVSWSPTTGLSNPNIANPICNTTGTYVITVTDASGCVATDTVKISYSGVNCCRITGNKTRSQVYPNPFKNGFMLKLPLHSVADIQIVDMQGLPQEFKRKASGTIQMGNELNPGVYTVIIKYSDGTREEIKLMKDPK